MHKALTAGFDTCLDTFIFSPILYLLSHLLFVPCQNIAQVNFKVDCFQHLAGNRPVEKALHELINEERRKAGLDALTFDNSLRSAARQHSAEMLQLDYFAHTSPVAHLKNPYDRIYHTGVSDFTVGENIAVHSLDKSPLIIARKFVQQWMNSPPHKENVLKPIFNTSGVGVISIKDSSITDTVRYGIPTKLITYKIRHYATQLFSDRSIVFTHLEVTKRKQDFLKLKVKFDFDRKMLLQINNYHEVFEPSDKSVEIDILFPIAAKNEISFGHIQNEQDNSFRLFFTEKFSRNTIIQLSRSIHKSVIRIKRSSAAIQAMELYFLNGTATRCADRQDKAIFLYVNDKMNYYFEIKNGKANFNIPIYQSGSSWEIELAFGKNAQKSVKNRIAIDVQKLYEHDQTQAVFVKQCQ